MGEQIRAFVDSAAEAFGLRGPVYQFGTCPSGDLRSRASLRGCFPKAAQVGFELDEGVEIERLPFPDGAARTVLCVGALERAYQPQRTMGEMIRILSPGGALLVCASVENPVPEQMPAYWRLTPRSVGRLLSGMEAVLVGWQGAEGFPHTVYGIGFKPPPTGAILEGTRRFLDRFQARLDEAAGRIAWPERLMHLLTCKAQFAVHLAGDRNLKHDLFQSCLPDKKTGTRLDLMD